MKKCILISLLFLAGNIANAQWEKLIVYDSANPGSDNAGTIYSIISIGSKLYAGAINGIYFSVDSGFTWEKISNSIPVGSSGLLRVYALGALGNQLFAGNNGGTAYTYASTDDGQQWIPSTTVRDARCFLTIDSEIIAGADGGVFVSNDSGYTWTQHNSGLIYATTIYSLAFEGNEIYLGTWDGVSMSINNCSNWSNLTGLPNDCIIYSLVSLNNVLYAGSGSGADGYPNTSGVYVYYNNTWHTVNNGLPVEYRPSFKALTKYNDIVFVGSYLGGVYFTKDTGQTWTSLNQGLGNYGINCLYIFGQYLYAGATYDGTIWRLPLADTAGIPPAPPAVTYNELYPNPCLKTLSINYYNLPFPGTTANIYNIRGQKVMENIPIVNKLISIDVSGLSQGLYFIEIINAAGATYKKFVKG